ncbi:glutaredoxin family protein [Thiohalomonas denitrificans]|uniref:Glutaredoxin-like domain n=1 Tax=Thiohalomonas denitrificans TaxID=415747 RepID=A0A1G5QCK2_9GAMM|nr:glutaredoxin family protein [Thiohalomonas denitrificans]SCZ59524.1 Glutaredoxin-like domain [Thiohalomonas denitrificans]
MGATVTLTAYLRSGCSLCEAMVYELAPLQQRYGFRIEAVDIDVSPELVSRYGERVPVLAGPDGELCHYFLDPDVLHRYFAAC